MKFDEMNAEQLEARLAELTAETSEEKRDALDNDALEERINEMEAIRAELEARRQAAAELEQKAAEVAGMTGEKIITEEKKMNFEVNSPEYREAWLKNLQHKELTAEERTALVHGEYAIPQETANKVWGKAELYPLFNAIDVMHIPGTVILPVEKTVNAANVVAMGTAATDSADEINKVSLGIYKIIKTIEITADVEAMAVPAFEDWLVNRLANKLYRKCTALVAAGSGSSQPTGLTSVDATGHTYTKAAITYADVLAIIAALPAQYAPNATFVMSRATFYQNVLAILDTANHPIVVQDVQAPAKFNILGYPVILEDEIGTDIVFGDLKEGYVWNFGKDIAIDRDESVGFRTGSTVFRGMCLADGAPTGVGLVRYTKAT